MLTEYSWQDARGGWLLLRRINGVLTRLHDSACHPKAKEKP